jgi:lipopolysaccharide export system protein LptC
MTQAVQPMSRFTDSRTRVVTWLKLVLPLVALGLLSTLFLLARTTDPDLAIRYSEVDVTELSKGQQVTAPAYSGLTRDGASITITATTVRPRNGNARELDAQTVSGRIEFRAGASADMEAPSAEVDTAGNLARFTGGVTMVASDGNRLTTETLQAALGKTEIVADTPVHAEGPLGTLDAASMRITQDAAGGYVAVFNGGVRLVYDPMKREE